MATAQDNEASRSEGSLAKSVSLLHIVSTTAKGVSFTHLRTLSGQPKATLHRLLQNLLDLRLLRFDADVKRYSLGYGLLEMAGRAWSQLDIRHAAREMMAELSTALDETVHLAVLDASDIIYIDKVESSQPFRLGSAIGLRNPAFCTGVGKALIAFLPTNELDQVIKHTKFTALTPNTLTTEADLRKSLSMIRQTGYAYDDEEHHLGIRCAAAPIFNHSGRPIASISVAAPLMRCDDNRLLELRDRVMDAAYRVTRDCGGVPPPRVTVETGVRGEAGI